MRQRALSGPVIARWPNIPDQSSLIRQPGLRISTGLALMLSGSIPDPVMLPPGALWGSQSRRMAFWRHVIVSDDAGQFNVGQHGCAGSCERLIHSSIPLPMSSARPRPAFVD